MAEGPRGTGTSNIIRDLSSVLFHALRGEASYDRYIEYAQREGDQKSADFFRRVREEYSLRAAEARQLLARRTRTSRHKEEDVTTGTAEGTATGVSSSRAPSSAPQRVAKEVPSDTLSQASLGEVQKETSRPSRDVRMGGGPVADVQSESDTQAEGAGAMTTEEVRREDQPAGKEPPTQPPRDAIILLPGLLQEPKDMIRRTSAKIRAALDSQAADPKTKFTSEESNDEKCQDALIGRATIKVEDSSKASTGGQGDSVSALCIDLYELNYKDMLIGRYMGRAPLLQILSLGWLILSNLRNFVKVVMSPAKTSAQKAQILLAVFLVMLLLAYIGILIASLIAIVSPGFDLSASVGSWRTSLASWVTGPVSYLATLPLIGPFIIAVNTVLDSILFILERALAWLAKYKANIIVVFTALGLFTTVSLKETISNASLWVMGATNYLTLGDRRTAITGQVYALLEHIQEKKDVSYERIHIVAYSFGTVVAIDTVYPHTEARKRIRSVNTLVTFGCPFDFIRIFWSSYFGNRTPLDPLVKLPSWLNIYGWIDVLASDFQNETEPRTHEGIGLINRKTEFVLPQDNKPFGPRINLKEYSLFQRVSLLGFKAHRNYWGDPEAFSPSCFDLIVDKLYGEHYLLNPRDELTKLTIQVSEANTETDTKSEQASLTPEKPGTYVFTVQNVGKDTHALRIEENRTEQATSEQATRNIGPGESDEIRVNLKATPYKISCMGDNHKPSGMQGPLKAGSYEIACTSINPEPPPMSGATTVEQKKCLIDRVREALRS